MATTISPQPVNCDEIGFISNSICSEAADGPESDTWQCSIVMICPGLKSSTIQTSTLAPKITRLIVVFFFSESLIGAVYPFR
ncbi:hypothetical protein [Flavobacterium sp. 3HN19-14]|uniref:hypothetical protein n=1 Tax=Flavobacterium sp. 3HN19-14 TaxID=3448133 RepID=UPI003EE347EA